MADNLAGWARVPWDAESRGKWLESPFELAEYATRIARVRECMAEDGLELLIVHGVGNDSADVAYLTGFTNFFMGDAVVLITHDHVALITTSIVHGEPMHSEIYTTWVEDVRCAPRIGAGARPIADLLLEVIDDSGVNSALTAVSGRFSQDLVAYLAAASEFSGATMKYDLRLSELRAIKSRAELDLIKQGCKSADMALLTGLEAAIPGATENQIAGAMAGAAVSEGADAILYFIQVGSGPRSGFRNVRPTERVVHHGESLYLGLAFRYRGYCIRIGTGASVGATPDDLHRFLEANALIVERSLAAAGPGSRASVLCEVATATAEELGVLSELWAGGHGVGLSTHDLPMISRLTEDTMREGMTFVFEPMLMRYSFATANAERLYYVSERGIEQLSALPLRQWE